MAAEFDLERLAQIRDVMGSSLPELVGGMLETMSDAIEQSERAVRVGDLDRAAKAAHACRNDALMLGARELLRDLQDLEQTARAGELVLAQDAMARVHDAWPRTRSALIRVASDL
jgi:HPt (histidine-containing phosphotransfer) domain-containing protein